MQAGTTLVVSERAEPITQRVSPNGQVVYSVPPNSSYQFGADEADQMVFHESVRGGGTGPDGRLEPASEGGLTTWKLPGGSQKAGAGQFVGHVHDRLHGADRACCGLVHVPVSQGEGGGGFALWRGRRAGRDGAGGLDPRFAAGAVFQPEPRADDLAIAAYGFIASVLPVWLLLCPRDYLSSFLKIGTIGLLVIGVILANPTLEAPAVNHQFSIGRRAVLRWPDFPLRVSSASCVARSPGSTRWYLPARRPR